MFCVASLAHGFRRLTADPFDLTPPASCVACLYPPQASSSPFMEELFPKPSKDDKAAGSAPRGRASVSKAAKLTLGFQVRDMMMLMARERA